MALEHFVNNVRTITAAGSFRELLDYLNQSTDLLAKHCNIIDTVLESLNVQQHSLGYLYALLAKFQNSALLSDNLHKLFKTFIVSCNGEQVRYSLIAYAELCHQYTLLLSKDIYCVQGIKILSQAVDKIRLFDSQLTAVHADLCQICLCAKLFKPALKFLDVDITSIAQTDDGNHDSKYFLLYYYYGGMIYTAIKNYERALYFFEVAVTTPALAMSHIMLEAYKKHILLTLLLHGKILPLPKYSPQITSRFMKPLAHSYHELAKCYCIGSEELRKTITKYRDIFVLDENMGLVKQVEASLCKKNIQRLTKTFLTLSLADVASRVKLSGPEEAEKYILKMINSGEIFAKINQKDGMIVFKEDPQHYNTTEMFEKKQEYISKVVELNKKVLKMEEDILLNPMFIKKVLGPNNADEEVVTAGQPKPSYMGVEPED